MEKKENQRVLLTKRLLKEGLLKMLLYKDLEKITQYTSHNTQRLDVAGMKTLLLKLKLFGGQY